MRAEPILKAKAKERLKTSAGGMHPQPKQNSAEAGEKGQTRDTIAKRAGVSHDTVDKFSTTLKMRKVEGYREATRQTISYTRKGTVELCRRSQQEKILFTFETH